MDRRAELSQWRQRGRQLRGARTERKRAGFRRQRDGLRMERNDARSGQRHNLRRTAAAAADRTSDGLGLFERRAVYADGAAASGLAAHDQERLQDLDARTDL